MGTLNIPRQGSIARGIFDTLRDAGPEGIRWAELNSVYTNHPRFQGSPRFAYMTLSRILSRYADRIERGLYKIRDLYADQLPVTCTCEKHGWGALLSRKEWKKTYPNGYVGLYDEGTHYVDRPCVMKEEQKSSALDLAKTILRESINDLNNAHLTLAEHASVVASAIGNMKGAIELIDDFKSSK